MTVERDGVTPSPLSGRRQDDAPQHTHRLDGFIAYYGRHYFAYWRHSSAASLGGGGGGASATDSGGGEWDGFDDATVRRAGAWDDVDEKVADGRLMPLLLFFSEVRC